MDKKRVFGTGGELLVHRLVAQGVNYAFTNTGSADSQGIEGTEVRELQALEAALRRGVDAINAGEPYLVDVRVATVGAGADSTWHQRFKLRR